MKSYKQEAIDLFNKGEMNKSQIARYLKAKHNLPMSVETVRKEVCRQVGKHKALNQECDEACAQAIAKQFVEVLIAPHFSEAAKTIFASKQNVRLLQIPK